VQEFFTQSIFEKFSVELVHVISPEFESSPVRGRASFAPGLEPAQFDSETPVAAEFSATCRILHGVVRWRVRGRAVSGFDGSVTDKQRSVVAFERAVRPERTLVMLAVAARWKRVGRLPLRETPTERGCLLGMSNENGLLVGIVADGPSQLGPKVSVE